MQKNYELLYIVHPDLEGSTDKVTEKVTGFITRPGGEVTNQEDWGKRKLAYPIAKNAFGVYVLVNFTIDSEKLSDVERDMRLSEEILRSMIVVVPDAKEFSNKPRKEKAADTTKVTKEKKTEAPANIIVAEEKPAKAKAKAEKVSPSTDAQDDTAVPKKAPVKKAAPKKTAVADGEPAESTKTEQVDEAERLKKLDEKLDELLK